MKKSACNFITLLIISFSTLLIATKNPKCHPQDQIVINKIQTSFGLTPPTPNCCDWDAVTCSNVAPFRVVSLVINFTVSGQIPAAIGSLSSLQTLQISNAPNITGNIPPAITKLTNLANLIISGTSVSGPIPASLANLKNITTLDLSENSLTGSIPPQLSQLHNLGLLNLSSNFLTGAIPKSMGKLDILTSLDLSENSFTGDASFFFAKKKIILNLLLQRNKFRFNLSNVEFPSSVRDLDLSHNYIFGSIPWKWTELELNFGINVSYNQLCGPIPQGGILQAFGVDSYSHNKCLCDAPLPPCK